MNYYPNFNQTQNPYYQVQYPTINGKIVDSYDVAKNQDIPFGSYGVFPKADMTSVFVKMWNKDGSTSFIEYERKTPEEPVTVSEKQDYSEIMNAIAALSSKLDSVVSRNNYQGKKSGGDKNE